MSKPDTKYDIFTRNQGDQGQVRSRQWDDIQQPGVIIFETNPRQSRRSLLCLMALVFGFILFKAVVMASIGGDVYRQSVDLLGQGNYIDQAGAFLMRPDFATQFFANELSPLF